MYKINIQEEIFNCPSNWGEVTLNQYKRISGLSQDMHNIARLIQVLHILTDIPEEKIGELDVKGLNEIDFSWINQKIERIEYKETIEICGVKYTVADFQKMSLAEYADIEEYCKEDYAKNLHIIIAILVRPVDDNGKILKYNAGDVMDRAKLFDENMNIQNIISITDFFFSGKQGQ